MIVKSKPLSDMFSVNNRNLYFSQEFQPFVKLENVLDKVDLLMEENVTVSCWPVLNKTKHVELNISKVDTIKTEIKEEVFSEHINDTELSFKEESLSCNTDVHLTIEDPTTIKSEKEDSSFELYSIQNSSDIDSIGNSNERNHSTTQDTDYLLEDKGIGTSSEEVSEDLFSLDLHLSPDSDTNEDETHSKIKYAKDSLTQTSIQNSSKDMDLSSDTSSLFSADKSNSSRTPVSNKSSPDIFEESLEVNSEVSAEESEFIKTRSYTKGHSSSDNISPVGDNRERQEEWDSQELSEVSQRLMLRSKQAKRLILEVIRKRQMEDETLDAFKKRLRRM